MNLLFLTKIAGFQHHDGAVGVLTRITSNEPLFLEREPKNPHDPNAIRIMYCRKHIGYVPRADSSTVSKAILAGHSVTCRKDPRFFNAIRIRIQQGDPLA